MPNAYFLSERPGEWRASAAALAEQGVETAVFSSLSDFLSYDSSGEVGCVVADVPTPSGALDFMMRLRVAAPEPFPVIVVAARADVALAVQAMKEGAADFLEKPVDDARLVESVLAAVASSRGRLLRAARQRELIARFRTLSAREKKVVDAVLNGRANREVASQLGIKPRTVETHRSNAMTKLGARTLPDLVRIWLDLDTGAAS